MTDTVVSFDGLAIERVGTVVFSVRITEDGEVLDGPWAICDHCGDLFHPGGQLAGRTVGVGWSCWETWLIRSSLPEHACPPVGDPLPATSVCGQRPCARCRVAA